MVNKHLVENVSDLKKICKKMDKESPVIAIDYETEDLTGASNGLDMINAEVIGIAFSCVSDAYYIDMESFTSWDPDKVHEVWRILLTTILNTTFHVLVSHNASFELHLTKRMLTKYGLDHRGMFTPGKWWDTMAMAVIDDENLIGVQVLLPDEEDNTFERRVGALSLKAQSRIRLGRHQRLWDDQFSSWSLEERVDYACDDAINCLDLAILLADSLREKGLMTYCEEVVLPQIFVSQAMEERGFLFDVSEARAAEARINKDIAELEHQVTTLVPGTARYKYAPRKPWTRAQIISLGYICGWDWPAMTPSDKPSITAKILKALAEKYPDPVPLTADDASDLGVSMFTWDQVREEVKVPFNSRSNDQLAAYLIEMGVRLPLTPTGRQSVSEESLKAGKRQLPDLPIWGPLFQLRKLQKLASAYITGILKVVWPEDNSLHPQWKYLGTVSGRYSCTKGRGNKYLVHKRGPASQTFPNPDRMDDDVKQYNPRQWIIPRPGYKFVIGDLSQAEVRMLAVLCEDATLIKGIKSGVDLHSANAAALYGQSWEEAEKAERKEMRTRAKTATFAVIYGAGEGTLQRQLDITPDQAEELLHNFYNTFPGILDFKDETTAMLKKQGYVTSWLGRRRTPIIIQYPPRVTASPRYDPELFRKQSLEVRMWTAAYNTAIKKSRFDTETGTRREREGRAQRQCINFRVQAGVGDMINTGAATLFSAGYNIVIQMHDEIVLEVLDNEKDIADAVTYMHEVFDVEIGGIPFVLDTVVGDSWNAGKE